MNNLLSIKYRPTSQALPVMLLFDTNSSVKNHVLKFLTALELQGNRFISFLTSPGVAKELQDLTASYRNRDVDVQRFPPLFWLTSRIDIA